MLLALAFFLPGSLAAQPGMETLRVAAAPCPPFVISEGGKLSGLGVYLWEQVAAQMGVQYELVEYPLIDMLNAIAREELSRRAQIGISCLSMTADRERVIDFSHSFHETYTAIAVRQYGMTTIIGTILTNPAVWRALAFVLFIAAVVGSIFFVLEHRINPKLYSMKGPIGKLMEAFIVGVLFVTRGPIRFYEFKTMTARLLSAVLAICSTFLIAAITAVLASAFTLQSLRTRVTGLQDLKNVRVVALESSSSSKFLRANGIAHQTQADLISMMDALERGHVDAVVSDAAFLKYSIMKGKEQGKFESLAVLPYKFDSQNYGFALERLSEFTEDVNLALLIVRKTPQWREKVAEYLGE
jgi:polar amino acid transport system substrate-binding protein